MDNRLFYNKHSLASRLTFYIVLCSSLITFFVISIMLYRQYESDIDRLDKHLYSIKVSSLPSIKNSLWEFNDLQVQTIIDSLINLDAVIGVAVHSFSWDGQPKVIKAGEPYASGIDDNNVLIKNFPIVQKTGSVNHKLGDLIVIASLDSVHQNLWRQAKLIIVTQGIKTFLITLLILLFIHRLLMRHLYTISNFAESLKLNGDFQRLTLNRDPPKIADELDHVVDTLNKMQSTLIEEQQKELAIEKEKSFIEATSKAKNDFLTHMSHEIRTPMNGVIGLLDLFEDDNLTDEQLRYLDLIKKSGQSLLLIINDILDLSKIEAHKLNFVEQEFSLIHLIEDCTSLYMASAKEKNIALIKDITPELQHNVIGDPLRIKQILLNLLSNAYKNTDEGSITIQLSLENPEPNQISDHISVRFSIRDTGAGIDADYKQKIFEAFEQGNPVVVTPGTGLGLTISKKLITLMNGEIGVTSEIGKGSEFWFTLPLIETSYKPQKEKREINQTKTPATNKANFDQSVLVVEDNTVNQQVIEAILSKIGIAPVILGNGAEAVDSITNKKQNFKVILMDCEMPIMDGFEASKRIREHEKAFGINPSIIISLSAHHDQAHKKRCEEAGMNQHITKPVTIKEIETLFSRLKHSQGAAHE